MELSRYKPIKLPVIYNFLKFKLIDSYVDWYKSKQKRTINPENIKLNNPNETVTFVNEEINMTTINNKNNIINKTLTTSNMSNVTTVMYTTHFMTSQITTKQPIYQNKSKEITTLFDNKIDITKFSTNKIEINTEQYLSQNKSIIVIVKNTDSAKIENYKICNYCNYIAYVISGMFLMTITLIIMIVYNTYKCVNRKRHRYAMQQILEILAIEVTEI